MPGVHIKVICYGFSLPFTWETVGLSVSVGVQADPAWPVAPDPGRRDAGGEEEKDEERRPDCLAGLQADQIIDFISCL